MWLSQYNNKTTIDYHKYYTKKGYILSVKSITKKKITHAHTKHNLVKSHILKEDNQFLVSV
jgi:hypothetical protein